MRAVQAVFFAGGGVASCCFLGRGGLAPKI